MFLEVSGRTNNCLKEAGITTIEQLAKLSDKELLSIKNFGAKCLAEIRSLDFSALREEESALRERESFERRIRSLTHKDLLTAIDQSNLDDAVKARLVVLVDIGIRVVAQRQSAHEAIANKGKKWTEDELAQLREMFELKKLDFDKRWEIKQQRYSEAMLLFKRTRNAIQLQLNAMGFDA